MNSFESCEARSFCNVGNVNFALQKVVDLLADPKFSKSTKKGIEAKVMIIAPYEVQRNLYTYEMQKHGITSMLNRVESKTSPPSATWYHGLGFTNSSESTSRRQRRCALSVRSATRSVTRDQRGPEGPCNTGKTLTCMYCQKPHYPRNCYRATKNIARFQAVQEAKKPQQVKKPEETSSTVETASTDRTARSEREKKSRKTNRAVKKMFRDTRKGTAQDDAADNNGDAEQPKTYAGRRLATTRILENCTEGWHRDAKKPLPIYFEKSPSKRMLDLGTIPKGDDIPFIDQVPALAIFDAKEQYYVTMAIGNQQEKEYHDRQHGKLHEFEVPARFIRDGRSLHEESKALQEYFMLISTSSASPDKDCLLPRTGDSAEIILKGIIIKPQQTTEDTGSMENDDIALHIKDPVRNVLKDNTIASKSASNKKLQDHGKWECASTGDGAPPPSGGGMR
ncbi:hypothetical protein SLS64_005294 [Diaporthe eres]